MEIELIIRDIYDLIHDVNIYEANTKDDGADAKRVFNHVNEGEEVWLDPRKYYDIALDGLVDATEALERAKERFGVVEDMLLKLVNDIEREALSAKVHSR